MATEDEINALPNTDLGNVLDDLKKTGEPQKTEQQEELDLAQFKNPRDLLKSYKEIQAAFTRVSQENKGLKQTQAELASLREEMELQRLKAAASPPIQRQQNYQPNYQMADDIPIEQRVDQIVSTKLIADVLEDLATGKDGLPDPEFNERYAYAQMVSQRHPELARSSKGVRKLFEMGDKLRSESLKRNASKVIESFLGVPLDEETIAKAKTLFLGEKGTQRQTSSSNAYMPDTSTSTRSGSESDRKPILESRLDEAVNKGDVDGTINALFAKTLAEE
jgi:hypothetical protein